MTLLPDVVTQRFSAAFRTINSAALGACAWGVAERRKRRPSFSMLGRHVVEALQVEDPLAAERAPLPPIDLVFVVHPRDADLLDTAIPCALAASRNPISRTVLIVPDDFVERGANRFPMASVVAESTVVTPSIAEHIQRRFGGAHPGWLLQQVLKFRAVLSSESAACLIVDADTLLLRARTWLTGSGVQVLSPSLEYWEPYAAHLARVWPELELRTPLSWVTHHQLMQKNVVAEMFGDDGGGLDAWIAHAEAQQRSPLSEYHSYGAYLFMRHRDRARLAQWNNLAKPRSEFPGLLVDGVGLPAAPRINGCRPHSVSFHHYL